VLTLLLTRHGHTDRSEPAQYLGQTLDIGLSDRGRADALRLRDRLADVALARVISSPLRRALETARLVRPDDPIDTDARLLEADYGAWEGQTVETIGARHPRERALWDVDPASRAPAGGESGQQIADRARAFASDLSAWERQLGRPEDDHRVLVVGHSTLNRILVAALLGVPISEYRRRFRQDWLNLTVLRVADDGLLAELLLGNDVAHLRGTSGVTW
jgi:broad specificity phosphatase PhoE